MVYILSICVETTLVHCASWTLIEHFKHILCVCKVKVYAYNMQMQ